MPFGNNGRTHPINRALRPTIRGGWRRSFDQRPKEGIRCLPCPPREGFRVPWRKRRAPHFSFDPRSRRSTCWPRVYPLPGNSELTESTSLRSDGAIPSQQTELAIPPFRRCRAVVTHSGLLYVALYGDVAARQSLGARQGFRISRDESMYWSSSTNKHARGLFTTRGGWRA